MSLANFSAAVVQNNSVTTVTAAMRTIKWMVQYVEDPDVNADDGDRVLILNTWLDQSWDSASAAAQVFCSIIQIPCFI